MTLMNFLKDFVMFFISEADIGLTDAGLLSRIQLISSGSCFSPFQGGIGLHITSMMLSNVIPKKGVIKIIGTKILPRILP